MVRAEWNGVVLAESSETIIIEGNHYFPPVSVNMAYFKESDYHTTCPWKGLASYYDIVVNGKVNKDAAWYYHAPKAKAAEITGYLAFWKDVFIVE